MVVCLLYTSRIHGPRFTVHGPRRSGSPPVTVCASFEKCVPGIFSFLAHNNVLYINNLTKCVPCVPCVPAFLSSFYDLHISPFFIFQIELKPKNSGTHGTHLYNPHGCSLFIISILAHIVAHTWHTPPVSGTHLQNH